MEKIKINKNIIVKAKVKKEYKIPKVVSNISLQATTEIKPKKLLGRKLARYKEEVPFTSKGDGNVTYYVYLDCANNHTRIIISRHSSALKDYLNNLSKRNTSGRSFNNTNNSINYFAWKKTFLTRTSYLGAFTIPKGKDTPKLIISKLGKEINHFRGAGRGKLMEHISKTTIYK